MNLLKADLYRLIKERSIYICSIAILLLIFINSLLQNSLMKLAPEVEAITITVEKVMNSSISGLFIVLLTSISIALFHSKEYAYNTIRNKVTYGESRAKIILIKTLESFIIATYFYILAILLSLAIGSMFFKFKFQDNYIAKIVSQYFLILGISAIVNLLITITKSSKKTILIAVLLFVITSIVGQFLPSLSNKTIVQLICRIIPSTISSLMLDSNPQGIATRFILLSGAGKEVVYGYMYLNAVLAGLFYTITTTTIATVVAIKQEYK